jgi:hypothetical protein
MTGIHSGQDSERKFRTAGGTGPLASIAELIEALAHLLRLEQGKPDLTRSGSPSASCLPAQSATAPAAACPVGERKGPKLQIATCWRFCAAGLLTSCVFFSYPVRGHLLGY